MTTLSRDCRAACKALLSKNWPPDGRDIVPIMEVIEVAREVAKMLLENDESQDD
jgi:hypothetical protein